MGPGGFPSLQNWCDLTTSGRVGSIPTRSRHSAARHVRRFLIAVSLSVLGLSPLGPAVHAQVADSARVGAPRPAPQQDTGRVIPDSLIRPPISPKRALLQSLLIPGWGQASLHRSTAGAIYVAVEMTSIAMLVQSKRELRDARVASRDSVRGDGGVYVANPLASQIDPRRQAVEDWTALLIFTHLFSAADAFVAAHLWDVPVQVRGHATTQDAEVSARIEW